jgi:hypothetical protein
MVRNFEVSPGLWFKISSLFLPLFRKQSFLNAWYTAVFFLEAVLKNQAKIFKNQAVFRIKDRNNYY